MTPPGLGHNGGPPLAPAIQADPRWGICLEFVLKREGGYVNDPDDPGGATNLGITLAVLREAWADPNLTAADVKALTRADAAAIYFARYWRPVQGDKLPQGVDLATFDFAVNSGPMRAAKYLQRCAGGLAGVPLAEDGAIGPASLRAVAACDPRALATRLCDARMTFLRTNAKWWKFGTGWTRRVDALRAELR